MADNIMLSQLIEATDKSSASKKGVSFYCSKRHTYIFIENVPQQNVKYSALKQK